MFPQQQSGSQTPQQHTVLGSVYLYTYTDPSKGKSILYPDIWTPSPSPFFYAGYHGSIVNFYDSNGSRVAFFEVRQAANPAPERSIRDILANDTTVIQSSIFTKDLSGLTGVKPNAHFDYFISKPASSVRDIYSFSKNGVTLLHFEGAAIVEHNIQFSVVYYPEAANLDPNYQREILGILDSLVAIAGMTGMNSNNGINQDAMNENRQSIYPPT